MSHPAQVKFCQEVKRQHPNLFKGVRVVDVGSLDVNGNNRRYFKRSAHYWLVLKRVIKKVLKPTYYYGIDVQDGRNVSIVGKAHDEIPFLAGKPIDVMISTECLEHDKHWGQTLLTMYGFLRPGGLMLITCAGIGRDEHGTNDNRPEDSPGTNDYYRNLSTEDIAGILPVRLFSTYFLTQQGTDIQFYGIKK